MKEVNLDLVYLLSVPVFLILSLVVGFKRRNLNPRAGWYLRGYYWSFFLAVAITFIVISPLIAYMPHLFRWGHVFFLLIFVFSYLYVRETLFPARITWTDAWLLIPLVLYLVDYAPVFMLSGDEKLRIIRGLSDQGLKLRFAEGWFMPPGSHNLIKHLFALVVWLAQAQMLYQASRIAELEMGQDFVAHRRWLQWLLMSQLLIFLPALVGMAAGRYEWVSLIANVSGIVAGLIQGFYLLMHPEVLYGLPPDAPQASSMNPGDMMAPPSLVTALPEPLPDSTIPHSPAYVENLDEETLDRIGQALERVMQEKQLYLDPSLKIADLAMATGFLSHKLSAYFHKRCQGSFYDYVNTLRVTYCVQKMETGEFKTKTLEALSHESGFQSRSTFIRAFKRAKGITPSEFVQSLK